MPLVCSESNLADATKDPLSFPMSCGVPAHLVHLVILGHVPRGPVPAQDEFRRKVAEAAAACTGATVGYVLDEWLAGHHIDQLQDKNDTVTAGQFLRCF